MQAPWTQKRQFELRVVDGLLLLLFFVGVPAIAGGIGYAALKDRPKSFATENYVLGSVACGLFSGVLIVYAQRMHADIRTWLYLWQIVCGSVGLLLLGIALGCGIGIFTYRFRSLARKTTGIEVRHLSGFAVYQDVLAFSAFFQMLNRTA